MMTQREVELELSRLAAVYKEKYIEDDDVEFEAIEVAIETLEKVLGLTVGGTVSKIQEEN